MNMRKRTRGQQWTDAADNAIKALEELIDLQAEYEDWYDNMPESLQSSPTGEKLETVVDLGITEALDTAQEAIDTDLPQGFGRD
tara:strand:+ start:100 stop:351 length:252 start_codon:yes stop_codon:yes gene_type:complete